MKAEKLWNWGVALATLLVLLRLTLPQGTATHFEFYNSPLTETASALKAKNQGGDLATYLTIAEDFRKHGWYHDMRGNGGIRQPGLPALFAFFDLTFGPEHPVGLSMTLFSCLLWTCIISSFFLILRPCVPLWLALVCWAGFLSLPELRFYLRDGAILTENYALVFAMFGSLIFFRSLKTHRSTRAGIASGACLVVSALFRGTTDLAMSAMTALTMAFLFVTLLQAFVTKQGAWTSLKQWANKTQPLLFTLLTFQVLIAPYKFYNLQVSGYYSVVAPTSDIWSNQWMSKAHLYKLGGGWIAEGGGGIACRIDPVKCDQIMKDEVATNDRFMNSHKYPFYKREALRTILSNPLDWLAIKAEITPRYWFTSPPTLAEYSTQHYLENTLSAISALCLLALGIYLIRIIYKRSSYHQASWGLFSFGILAGLTIPILLIHYEVRYLYPIKTAAYAFFAMWIALIWSQKAQFSLKEAQDANTPHRA